MLNSEGITYNKGNTLLYIIVLAELLKDLYICKTKTSPTTCPLLSLRLAEALKATTGNSACKQLIHFSAFSLGTKSTTQDPKRC